MVGQRSDAKSLPPCERHDSRIAVESERISKARALRGAATCFSPSCRPTWGSLPVRVRA